MVIIFRINIKQYIYYMYNCIFKYNRKKYMINLNKSVAIILIIIVTQNCSNSVKIYYIYIYTKLYRFVDMRRKDKLEKTYF